jgi:hypothetical protein
MEIFEVKNIVASPQSIKDDETSLTGGESPEGHKGIS